MISLTGKFAQLRYFCHSQLLKHPYPAHRIYEGAKLSYVVTLEEALVSGVSFTSSGFRSHNVSVSGSSSVHRGFP
jgi:hypothetical protein